MKGIFDSIVVRATGISAQHPLADVVKARSNIIELTESSHAAALHPNRPGGLSHSERVALACRIARLNEADALAHHYENMIEGADGSDVTPSIADSTFEGASDARLRAIIRHTDLVAVDVKKVTEDDISALRSAGISEEDIVRLSELIAFVSYQIRLVAGLKLMVQVA